MRGRWPWLALAVSVALNLFLLGLAAGGRLVDRNPRSMHHRAAPLSDLTPEERRLVRERIRDAALRVRADRVGAREARRAAAAAVAADPFDRAAAEAALARSREGQDRARARSDAALLDAASALSPEGRDRLAEAIARGAFDGPRLRRQRPR